MAFNLKRNKQSQVDAQQIEEQQKLLLDMQKLEAAGVDVSGLAPEEIKQKASEMDSDSLLNAYNKVKAIEESDTTMSSGDVFNLKKSQINNESLPNFDFDSMENDEIVDFEEDMPSDDGQINFSSFEEFRSWVDNRSSDEDILSTFSEMNDDSSKDAMKAYFSDEPSLDRSMREELLADIYFNIIPVNMKDKGNDEVAGIERTVANSLLIVKKTAQKRCLNQNIKTAQHKTLDNVVMWGPSPQPRIDPFLRQPVSDWHIVERNKGFGLVVDDIWNIDYEAIWRGNIMDKYSRPYKNKEGKWVGGYLNKRFEVDSNIPVGNDYQLKPGQLRKPILPEYGNLESRLQASRASGGIKGGPVVDRSDPTDWNDLKAFSGPKNAAFNVSKKKS